MLNKKKNNKGFTLVELLVVIAIIGILAVVAVPALFKNIEKSKVADLQADVSAIKSAAMSYVADKNEFPTTGIINNENIATIFDNELENISNPFKATYTLESHAADNSTNDDAGNGFIKKGDLTLTVTFAKGKGLSASSITKLQNDMGTMIKVGTTGTGDNEVNEVIFKLLNANGLTAPAAS